MKKLILLSGLLFSIIIHAQKPLSRNWLSKVPATNDSVRLNKERQQSLSAYQTTAKRERKNIMIFSASTKNTKDLDALYIGRLVNKEVYKVDLSAVTSKYIGETEKNLNLIFADAEASHMVLFFDDADELFGRVKQPESIANFIQNLAQAKNVLTIFWCEEDCLPWLKKSRYVLVQ